MNQKQRDNSLERFKKKLLDHKFKLLITKEEVFFYKKKTYCEDKFVLLVLDVLENDSSDPTYRVEGPDMAFQARSRPVLIYAFCENDFVWAWVQQECVEFL